MADIEEMKEEGSLERTTSQDVDEKTEWAPVRALDSQSLNQIRSNSRSRRALSRVISQNGYSCRYEESNHSASEGDAEAQVEKDPYEVGWDDGDNDPLNPRSKSHIRKWFIVILCSVASLCVYVS